MTKENIGIDPGVRPSDGTKLSTDPNCGDCIELLTGRCTGRPNLRNTSLDGVVCPEWLLIAGKDMRLPY